MDNNRRNTNKNNRYDKIVKKNPRVSNTNNSSNNKNNEMNAGRANKIHKDKKKGKKNVAFTVFKVFLFSMIALCIIGVGVVAGVLTGIIDDTEAIDLDDFDTTKQTTYFYDKDGNQMTTLYKENRVMAKYTDFPQHLVDAVTSIEDERFFKHHGVDIKRTAGAVVSYVLHGGKSTAGGGSTITQQLVKNVTSDKETHWTRKVREWYRAIMLETKLSKQQIMETYLNTIYLGEGSYGVEVACQNYFAKSVKDISIEEAACIAAIIQLPGSYNPYTSEESKAALLARQKVVLSQMKKLGKITEEQYNKAVNTEVVFQKSPSATKGVNSYFVDAVIEDLVTKIMKQKNVSRGMALNILYTGGYKVYTTMDSRIQQIMQEEYGNTSLFYTSRRYGELMQSAMVVTDYHTGNVVGMMGGVTWTKEGDLSLNRATQSPRQPGSSIKPLAVYGPAFELGKVTPTRKIVDEKINIKLDNGQTFSPKEWYGYYKGEVTIKNAIENSMNVPAVKTLQMVGLDYSYKFLENLGITTLSPKDKGLASLALGGLTNGVTTYEMASAYGTIANGGIYIKPKVYSKVLDKNGKEVFAPDNTIRQVMKEETSYMLIDCMKSVMTRGTGTTANFKNMTTAGKTGTTNDEKDRWFCGFTPYYSAATWIGYDNPKEIDRSGYGVTTIWKNVMKRVHEGLANKDFSTPTGLYQTNICSKSGLLPTEACTAAGTVSSEMFAANSAPTETCGIHKFVEVCAVSGKLPAKYCTELKRVVVTPETDITEQCTLHLTPPAPVVTEDEDEDEDDETTNTDKKNETTNNTNSTTNTNKKNQNN